MMNELEVSTLMWCLQNRSNYYKSPYLRAISTVQITNGFYYSLEHMHFETEPNKPYAMRNKNM